jgi:hypothetical protein
MAVILKSSPKQQTAWNKFHSGLRGWELIVDGKPINKLFLFNRLYEEDSRNPALEVIQSRLTETFEERTFLGVTIHSVAFIRNQCVAEYDPKSVEENNVRAVLRSLVAKESKKIELPTNSKDLICALNKIAFTVYSHHEQVSKDADKLYVPI